MIYIVMLKACSTELTTKSSQVKSVTQSLQRRNGVIVEISTNPLSLISLSLVLY